MAEVKHVIFKISSEEKHRIGPVLKSWNEQRIIGHIAKVFKVEESTIKIEEYF